MGQMSRMWGTTLDHIEEVEVVTADGTVARASIRENPDLFFVRTYSRLHSLGHVPLANSRPRRP